MKCLASLFILVTLSKCWDKSFLACCGTGVTLFDVEQVLKIVFKNCALIPLSGHIETKQKPKGKACVSTIAPGCMGPAGFSALCE